MTEWRAPFFFHEPRDTSLLPGATVKKDGNYWSWRVVVDGRKPKVGDLLEHSNEWLTAIGQAVIAFNRLDED